MRTMSESIPAFNADAQGLNNNMSIEGIIYDMRSDALKMLGEKGLAEWKAKGDIFEIDDIYGMDWTHYAALSNDHDELIKFIMDKGWDL